MPPLLAEVGRLEQRDPGPLGKVIDGMAEARPDRPLPEPSAAVSVTEFQRSSERCDSTSKGRIDSISSPKNSMRTGSVESVGKTSRMPPRTLNSPGTSTTSARDIPRSSSQAVRSSMGTRFAHDDGARHLGESLGFGDWLQESPETGRRSAAAESGLASFFEHPHPPAEHLIGGVQLARQLFPGGENLRNDSRKRRHVVAKVVNVADMSQQDHQRRRRVQPERGRHQGRRRAPGTVNRRTPAVLERRHDLGKARRALDLTRQVLELPNGGCPSWIDSNFWA